jgi:hypothetical protein
MTSIIFDENEILSGIQKLSPQDGDILLFYIKTDDNGMPLVDLETVQQTAEMLMDILDDTNQAIFLFDKICLFSIENSKEVVKRLEKTISTIQEANDKVRDIENGNSEEGFLIIDGKKEMGHDS